MRRTAGCGGTWTCHGSRKLPAGMAPCDLLTGIGTSVSFGTALLTGGGRGARHASHGEGGGAGMTTFSAAFMVVAGTTGAADSLGGGGGALSKKRSRNAWYASASLAADAFGGGGAEEARAIAADVCFCKALNIWAAFAKFSAFGGTVCGTTSGGSDI